MWVRRNHQKLDCSSVSLTKLENELLSLSFSASPFIWVIAKNPAMYDPNQV